MHNDQTHSIKMHCAHNNIIVVCFYWFQELARGQTLLLDLSEECDDENQDFDSWEPDPIDADPSK